jgi:hypothetical protein
MFCNSICNYIIELYEIFCNWITTKRVKNEPLLEKIENSSSDNSNADNFNFDDIYKNKNI